jgi:hypothetical protein
MSKDTPNLSGTCHCGAVSWNYQGSPARLVVCNCSICRRLRPLWAHAQSDRVTITAAADSTIAYVWGDKGLAFHTCKRCGCTTHWIGLEAESPQNMAVNAALADPRDIADLPVRHFDGADTWQFVD